MLEISVTIRDVPENLTADIHNLINLDIGSIEVHYLGITFHY